MCQTALGVVALLTACDVSINSHVEKNMAVSGPFLAGMLAQNQRGVRRG